VGLNKNVMEILFKRLDNLRRIYMLACDYDHVPNYLQLDEIDTYDDIIEEIKKYEGYSDRDMIDILLLEIINYKTPKTSREWGDLLPTFIKEKFINNINKQGKFSENLYPNMPEAILFSFDWDETPEHISYWKGAYEAFGGDWGKKYFADTT
jgi:hypothetical protein